MGRKDTLFSFKVRLLKHNLQAGKSPLSAQSSMSLDTYSHETPFPSPPKTPGCPFVLHFCGNSQPLAPADVLSVPLVLPSSAWRINEIRQWVAEKKNKILISRKRSFSETKCLQSTLRQMRRLVKGAGAVTAGRLFPHNFPERVPGHVASLLETFSGFPLPSG